jgi:hypothetical protein
MLGLDSASSDNSLIALFRAVEGIEIPFPSWSRGFPSWIAVLVVCVSPVYAGDYYKDEVLVTSLRKFSELVKENKCDELSLH